MFFRKVQILLKVGPFSVIENVYASNYTTKVNISNHQMPKKDKNYALLTKKCVIFI